MGQIMRQILLLSTILLFSSYTLGDPGKKKRESTLEFYDDYLMVRYMPSRGSFRKGDPVVLLKGETRTSVSKRDGSIYSTNKDVQNFYQEIKKIAEKGIKSNQRHFHVAVNYIEVKYKGETIRLEYTGKSGDKKYRQYEAQWRELYQRVYNYLSVDLAPSKLN